MKQSNSKNHSFRWYAGVTLASLILIAFALLSPKTPFNDIALEDLSLLSSNNKLEFYQNIAFYQWLEQEANTN